jgi:hypothetical protein
LGDTNRIAGHGRWWYRWPAYSSNDSVSHWKYHWFVISYFIFFYKLVPLLLDTINFLEPTSTFYRFVYVRICSDFLRSE